MSAAQALKAARDAGIRIGVDGDALTLDADAAPDAAVLDLLSRHKAGVIALLRTGNDGWSGKTGGRCSTNGRQSPSLMAGCRARQPRPAPSPAASPNGSTAIRCAQPPARCLGCGVSDHAHNALLPFGTEPTGHAWLHSRCWDAWHASRTTEAVAALSTLGISMRTSP